MIITTGSGPTEAPPKAVSRDKMTSGRWMIDDGKDKITKKTLLEQLAISSFLGRINKQQQTRGDRFLSTRIPIPRPMAHTGHCHWDHAAPSPIHSCWIQHLRAYRHGQSPRWRQRKLPKSRSGWEDWKLPVEGELGLPNVANISTFSGDPKVAANTDNFYSLSFTGWGQKTGTTKK